MATVNLIWHASNDKVPEQVLLKDQFDDHRISAVFWFLSDLGSVSETSIFFDRALKSGDIFSYQTELTELKKNRGYYSIKVLEYLFQEFPFEANIDIDNLIKFSKKIELCKEVESNITFDIDFR